MYNSLTVLAHGREALALTKMAMRCARLSQPAPAKRVEVIALQIDTSYGIHQTSPKDPKDSKQGDVPVSRRWHSPLRIYTRYNHGLAIFLSSSLES
jgi:hypothetical protein